MWRLFCSMACLLQNKREDLHWREKADVSRYEQARAERRAELAEEVEGLVRFGVPRSYAWAVLTRIADRWRHKGRRRALYETVERPRAKSAGAAEERIAI
jgi:hypothetical protein